MSYGDEFAEMPCFCETVECLALNGALVGVTIKWQNNISGETFASRRTNTQVVRHSKPGLFNVTAIPLGVRRVQLSGAGDGKRFGGGGPVGLRKLHAVRCVSGHQRQSNDYTQWESRAQADTNAVRGETRDRALVTTVRGRHSSDKTALWVPNRANAGFFFVDIWWYLKLTMNNHGKVQIVEK